jgi:hypothetical protein
MAGEGKSKIVVSAPPGGCLTRLARMVVALVVIAVLLAVTAGVVMHSDGFRQLAAERLTAAAGGLEMQVARSRTGWPCDLVLEGVETPGAGGGAAGFRADEVRVGPRPVGGWRVRVRGGLLNLERSAEDEWRPGCFAGLGDLPWGHVSDISRLSRPHWQRGTLRLNDITVRWLGGEGAVLASASGLTFSMQPVQVDGRRLCLYRLGARLLAMPDGKALRDVNREWLASEGSDFIELEPASGTGSNAPAAPWR